MPKDNAKTTAYERLKMLLAESEGASYDWVNTGKSTEWRRNVEAALRRLYGDKSDHVKAFKDVRYSPLVFGSNTPDSVWAECFEDGMTSARALIRSAIQEFEDYDLRSSDNPQVHLLGVARLSPGESARPSSRRVFVVHGHDVEMKEAVARFLERLELEPIVLSEQASGGDTIIEKFERCADAAFAVVLLSPDDIGAAATTPNDLKPRARQNAVLELGYFLGALGRCRVSPIVRDKLELPSDVHGLVYVPFDGDAWKIQIVKELKNAGFVIDANKAF